jgi:hypothetical protein
MTNYIRSLSLPRLINLDALACSIMGAGLIAASAPISSWTTLPSPLLLWAGMLLLPVAAFMAVCARLRSVPKWAAKFIVLGNCGWVIASFALPSAGFISPNPLGWLLLGGQAGFVAVLAVAEFRATERAGLSTQGGM